MVGGKLARCIMVADANNTYLDKLKVDPKCEAVPIACASEPNATRAILSDKKISLMGIFINPCMPIKFDITLIRTAHQYRPATPIFVLFDQPPPFSDQELLSMGVQRCIKKPISYTEMVEIVDPPIFNEADALEKAKNNKDKVGDEISLDDTLFVPIRAATYIAGAKSFFDVYVQLSSGRYVKILTAGDEFSKERVQSYLQKGVEFFFIPKEMQESYIQYCDKIADSLLKRDTIPVAVQTKQVLTQGQEVSNFLQTQGISEVRLQHATRYVEHVNTLITKNKLKKNDILKSFLADIAMYEHGNAVCTIAALLMEELEFTDPNVREIIGFACMFHDIGLKEMPEELHDENEDEMDEGQLELYHSHPSKGALILSTVPKIDQITIQAVEQHHERRGRQGFPKQLSGGSINMISELVGICDHFCNIMKQAKTNKELNVAHEMEQRVFHGFSYKIIEAFRVTVLGGNKKQQKKSG